VGHLSETQSWHLRRALQNALIIHPRTLETRTISIPPAEHLHAFVWSRGHARSVTQRRRWQRRRRLRRRDAPPRLTKQGRWFATTPRRRRPAGIPVTSVTRTGGVATCLYEFHAISIASARHDVVFCSRWLWRDETNAFVSSYAQHSFFKGRWFVTIFC